MKFFLFQFLIGFTVTNSIKTFFDEAVPPKIISVMSMQRSGSTTVSRLLSSHKCVLWGNEIFSGGSQDVLGAHDLLGYVPGESREDPLGFLLKLNKSICKSESVPKECNGRCTVIVKIFNNHQVSEQGISDIISSEDVGIIVLQRNLNDWYSSSIAAWKQGDWNTTPHDNRPEREIFQTVPVKNKDMYTSWFEKIRSLSNEVGKLYLEVPFSSVKTCNLFDMVLPSAYKFFGIDFDDGVEISNGWKGDNIEDILLACRDVVFF